MMINVVNPLICFTNTSMGGGVSLAHTKREKGRAEQKETAKPQKSWLSKNLSCIISVLTLCVSLAAPVISYGRYSERVDQYGKDIDEMRETISELRDSIGDVSQLTSAIAARIDAAERDVDRLYQDVFAYRPTSAFAASITKTYSSVDAPSNSGIETIGATTKIVYSKNIPGHEYTPTELADQPLFLPYTESGKEVYFYGQVDESGSWDGHCIVNIYQKDRLVLITDAQYKRGKLLSFQQAFPDSLPNGDAIWAVSNRTMRDGYSEGETWRYFRNEDCTKAFTLDSAVSADMMSVDAFKLKYAKALEGYYCGNVSDGSYNDDTGGAYYAQFFLNGTVKTLYVGRFENGNFEDATGTAWMIGKNDEGDTYSYYRGTFTSGKAVQDARLWKKSLTPEDVLEIIAQSEREFACDLKWELDKV